MTQKGKERPGKPWHKNHLYRMLRNPVYIGKVEYKGEVYEGEHEGIIDMELRALRHLHGHRVHEAPWSALPLLQLPPGHAYGL